MDFFSAAVARSIEKPLALFFEVISVCACYFSIMNMFVHIHMYQIWATFFFLFTFG